MVIRFSPRHVESSTFDIEKIAPARIQKRGESMSLKQRVKEIRIATVQSVPKIRCLGENTSPTDPPVPQNWSEAQRVIKNGSLGIQQFRRPKLNKKTRRLPM